MKTSTPAIPAFTTWTCDRCGATQTVHAGQSIDRAPQGQPPHWNFLHVDGTLDNPKDLCPNCSVDAILPIVQPPSVPVESILPTGDLDDPLF